MKVEQDVLVEGYLAYLRDVGRKTRRTVIDVRCTLGRAATGMMSRHPDTCWWDAPLQDYLHWLEQERRAGRTRATLAKYVSHLRGLLEYAFRSGRTERNVLDGFTLADAKRRTEPCCLTLEEARALVAGCARRTARERRDRLMVLLLYGCGLRTGELCALNIEVVDRERQELRVLKAKGDRPRVVPVPDAVYTELLAYLLERGARRGALFRTEAKRRRITAKDVNEVVRRAVAAAGLVPGAVTPRTLRHSFATHLMDCGVDLAVIASLMGHRSPQETGVYLHVLPHRREAAVDNLMFEEGL